MHVRIAALIIVAATVLLSLDTPYEDLRATCSTGNGSEPAILACTELLNRTDETQEARQFYYGKRVQALHRSGEYDQAINDANNALAINPNDVITLIWRGYSKNAVGDITGARADFEKAQQVAPNNKFVLFNVAKQMETWGEATLALEGYEKVLEIDPEYWKVGPKYLYLLYDNVPREEFEAALVAAEARWADRAWPHSSRVNYELLVGYDSEKALRAAELSTSIKPDPINDLFLFAMIHMKIGDEGKGVEFVRRYAEENEKLDVTKRGFLGETFDKFLSYMILGQDRQWIHRSHAYAALGKESLARAEYENFLNTGGQHAQKLLLDVVEGAGVPVSAEARAGSVEHINQAINDHIRHLEQKMGFSNLGPQPG